MITFLIERVQTEDLFLQSVLLCDVCSLHIERLVFQPMVSHLTIPRIERIHGSGLLMHNISL